jgi:hypothetical protein
MTSRRSLSPFLVAPPADPGGDQEGTGTPARIDGRRRAEAERAANYQYDYVARRLAAAMAALADARDAHLAARGRWVARGRSGDAVELQRYLAEDAAAVAARAARLRASLAPPDRLEATP